MLDQDLDRFNTLVTNFQDTMRRLGLLTCSITISPNQVLVQEETTLTYSDPTVRLIEEEMKRSLISPAYEPLYYPTSCRTYLQKIYYLLNIIQRGRNRPSLHAYYLLYSLLDYVTPADERTIRHHYTWTITTWSKKIGLAERTNIIFNACGKAYLHQTSYLTPRKLSYISDADFENLWSNLVVYHDRKNSSTPYSLPVTFLSPLNNENQPPFPLYNPEF